MTKALKIELSSDFGMFRDLSELNSVYNSKQIPSNLQLAGLLGAIIGYSGMQKYWNKKSVIPEKKRVFEEDELPDYYKELRELEYSIISKNGIYGLTNFVVNNTTNLFSTNIDKPIGGSTYNIKYNVLNKPVYVIYVYFSKLKEEQYNKLKDRLENDESYFQAYFGLPYMPVDIDYLGEVELGNVEEGSENRINSWYRPEDISVDMYTEHDTSEGYVYQYKETYPSKLNPNMLRSHNISVEYSTMIGTTKVPLYKDREDDLVLYKLVI